MRLGVTLASSRADGGALTGDALIGAARRIEEIGFDSLWCFDAIGRGFILPDPLIGVSVAARVTTRLEVGTCILQVPLRRPVELAHRILTAHLVCQGRLLLGVGPDRRGPISTQSVSTSGLRATRTSRRCGRFCLGDLTRGASVRMAQPAHQLNRRKPC